MHMHKKFEINQTKIKGGCQSGRKVVTRDSQSDLSLDTKDNNFLYRYISGKDSYQIYNILVPLFWILPASHKVLSQNCHVSMSTFVCFKVMGVTVVVGR